MKLRIQGKSWLRLGTSHSKRASHHAHTLYCAGLRRVSESQFPVISLSPCVELSRSGDSQAVLASRVDGQLLHHHTSSGQRWDDGGGGHVLRASSAKTAICSIARRIHLHMCTCKCTGNGKCYISTYTTEWYMYGIHSECMYMYMMYITCMLHVCNMYMYMVVYCQPFHPQW